MAIEIKIPIPDQTTEEVRIVTWCKGVGDAVKQGEAILEIETDKAVMEVEAAGEGVLLKQLVEVDDMVPVGDVVGFIGPKGADIPDEGADSAEKAATEPQQAPNSQQTEAGIKATPLARKIAQKKGIDLSKVTGVGPGGRITRGDVEAFDSKEQADTQTAGVDGRIFASPNAKRLAKELCVDIGSVKGSGANGRIIGKDVEAYAKSKPSVVAGVGPEAGTEVGLTKMRRAIGINLQNSFRDTPHFNVTMSIDMTKAMKFRDKLNDGKDKSQKVSVNDLVVKACARSLREYPAVNSVMLEDKIKYHADVNIGVATAVEDGLIVPVVPNTDKLDWFELASETKRVVAQARGGKLVGVGKGTFTISNLGMFGVEEFTAIINPPEGAILAVGAVKETVIAVDGMIMVKPMMRVTLCSDHRLVDGALAARFLQSVKHYFEEDIC